MNTVAKIVLFIWRHPSHPLTLTLNRLEGLQVQNDEEKINGVRLDLKKLLPDIHDLLIEDVYHAFYVFSKGGYFSRLSRRETLSELLNGERFISESVDPTLDPTLDTVSATPEGFQVQLHSNEKTLEEGVPATEIFINYLTRTCVLRNYGLFSHEDIATIARAGKFIQNHHLKFRAP